jgi:hypothetical protein
VAVMVVVVLVLALVVLVLAELVIDYLVCVMLFVLGDPPVGFSAFGVVVAFVLVGLTVIVVAVAYVLVGVTVMVVLVLSVVVVVIVVVLVLAFVVVLAFVLAKDADLLLIASAARRSGAIHASGRACSASSSRGCRRGRSLLAGPDGISVSQVGRLRGEVNHDCLGAVVADGDVLLNRTVARRSGGGCSSSCSRRGASCRARCARSTRGGTGSSRSARSCCRTSGARASGCLPPCRKREHQQKREGC